MKPIQTFVVVPNLPEPIGRLRELAHNLYWTWDHDTLALFWRLDPDVWQSSGYNPVLMLGLVGQQALEAAAADDGFLIDYERVCSAFDAYMKSERTWYAEYLKEKHPPLDSSPLAAYFSAEFGLTGCLSIFAGGLGILAGDHLKSCSDLGLPVVGVGLLYQEGYFRQYLNEAGWQMEAYEDNDFHNLPLALSVQPNGDPIRVAVEYSGRTVYAQIWTVHVGRTKLFLLDTHLPENSEQDRAITNQLYGGDREIRIKQEILLGIGGHRALQAMGLEPPVQHMNEGHSAFLALERIRFEMEKHHLTFIEAREVALAGLIFTTHTPEPAGHDYFPPDLMDRYFEGYRSELGISRREFLGLGRQNPADDNEYFCMTVLALRLSAHNNAVSRLHGEVTRTMWNGIWRGLPEKDVPIEHITNGIHLRSWVSSDFNQLYDHYVGQNWRERPAEHAVWQKIYRVPDETLWAAHERRRERLVEFGRQRLKAQWEKRRLPSSEVAQAAQTLDPRILTVVFARRFVPYKRPALLFRDPDRLARILTNPDRPIQVIFAGKAPPQDSFGRAVIQQIVQQGRQPQFKGRIAFLDDYDMSTARYLVQGADVWLNNPRRPHEACGTSGMKAAANGVLNVSTLDGWWDEAWRDAKDRGCFIGWAIGQGEQFENDVEQDKIEAEELYDLLEHIIAPAFYERNGDGIPRRWLGYMRSSIANLCHYFNTHRMSKEYAERFYLPTAIQETELTRNEMTGAKRIALWRSDIEKSWPQVRIDILEEPTKSAYAVGEMLNVAVAVTLGNLSPDDVAVDLYSGHIDSASDFCDSLSTPMQPEGKDGSGRFLYRATIELPDGSSGLYGYTVRVLPSYSGLGALRLPGLVAWAPDGS